MTRFKDLLVALSGALVFGALGYFLFPFIPS